MESYQLDVCDLKLAFRTAAGPERVERARCYVDEIYAQMKAYGGPLGKDKVLVMMLISLADDFLQLREQHSRADGRLDELLQSLKESGMGSEGDEMPPEGK
ncbi:MAG: cell division protein ZapA [Mailhella sp.]|nr:cell division protein ZapA [Mailhella sp.]